MRALRRRNYATSTRWRWLLAALATLMVLPGCGAGLITGVTAGGGGGSTPESRPPELSLVPILPLVPAENTARVVVVANAQIPPASRLRVRVDAAGVSVDQLEPTAAGQGGSTSIRYVVETGPIRAVVGSNGADVPGTLSVVVDDVAIASAPIVLARQPVASLDLASGALFLSPFGERVSVFVDGLRSTEAADVQLFVRTADPSLPRAPGGAAPTVTRLCTNLELLPGPTAGIQEVRAVVPGNTFPAPAELFVRDALAGESTVAAGAYYRPDIAVVLPSQGPTTGGSLVTLVGNALVPYDFGVVGQLPPLHFEDVSLQFAKGGRIVTLGSEDLRISESSRDRLVFTMPASPDGRAGEVDVVLRVDLGGAVAQVTASLFLYASPQPFFGPRGTTLERLPVAVAPIALDAAPGGDDAPDFAALYDEGGVAFLQLLLAQENGMFTRFGAPRQIADHEVAAELGPRDLCAGDFDGDHVPDMFLINAGAATAVHHLVLGQAKPAPPLGTIHRFAANAGTWRCRAADFDGDGLTDVVLVPGSGAPAGLRPEVWLARPLAIGHPAFAAPLVLPVRQFAYEALDLDDFDGDGHLDLAFVSGTTLQLDVVFGLGDGTFGSVVNVDFAVPGYTPDANSQAVGLHGCRNGMLQSLGLVLAGLESTPIASGPTRPTVAVLHQTAPRTFVAPTPVDVEVIPTEPLALSLAADLDQANTLELALAVRGDPQFVSLGLLRFGTTRFQPIVGGIELGAESPRQIRALHFDRAFPATPQSSEAKAVFVVHESEIDGARERRLSTRLLYADANTGQLTLLPPDAGAQIGTPIQGIAGGNFHAISVAGAGSVRDLALARNGALELLENDGFGGFPRPSNRLDWPGLLPQSVQLLPSTLPEIESLVFANGDSRLGVWRHDPEGAPWQTPTLTTTQLRLRCNDPALQAAALSDRTQIVRGDVDGDGVSDLVVLLCFALPQQGPESAQIALMRGKAAPASNEFPFFEPTALAAVHGNASSLALGDFAMDDPGQPVRLELAVAVPRGTAGGALDGNHIRFFRYESGTTPAGDHFVASSRSGGPQVLLAGSGPTRVVAADFDRDQLVDLLVAAADDNSLRLFRNGSTPGTGAEVAVGEFQESLGSPRPLAAGTPRALRLGDVNGDGSLDAVVAVEWTNGVGVRSTTVSFYLSTGAGEFATPDFVSATRVGDRDARLSLDLGDWNRDGVLDLFLGWDTAGPSDRNVRVLFGGTR